VVFHFALPSIDVLPSLVTGNIPNGLKQTKPVGYAVSTPYHAGDPDHFHVYVFAGMFRVKHCSALYASLSRFCVEMMEVCVVLAALFGCVVTPSLSLLRV